MYLGNEEKCEEYCGAYQKSQTKQSSMHLVIVTQCKLHHCQQSQDDAVDVNDEGNLFALGKTLFSLSSHANSLLAGELH